MMALAIDFFNYSRQHLEMAGHRQTIGKTVEKRVMLANSLAFRSSDWARCLDLATSRESKTDEQL